MDDPDDTHNALAALWRLAASIIDAGYDVLPAAIWRNTDGTVSKAPLLTNGHLGAHRDKQLIYQQLTTPPHYPKTVPQSHEVVVAFVPGSGECGVLDCDVKHGKAGQAALSDLVTQHGTFYGAVWNSPSGGANILFAKPPDTAYSNVSPWPGIDVRADNGWVVAPGNDTPLGAWTWKVGDFGSVQPLPTAMTAQLQASDFHTPKATNAQTAAFIEASPHTSAPAALEAFEKELDVFRQAQSGSRHAALLRLLSWVAGMGALDFRMAIDRIKPVWLDLTPGEGREDEVSDIFAWVAGQELRARQFAQSAQVIVNYQPSDSGIYLDWDAFADRDPVGNRWLVERFWPWGRGMALWAPAKEGKSELMLWCACKLALGEHPWDGSPVDPVDVAYFDFEMTEDDLEQRLDDFGIDPRRLKHLHYALLPTLPPLDTKAGGEALLGHITAVDAKAVVIETFGRAVKGEEDRADTVQDFYLHTGMRLKAAGIGYVRTDHAGHDKTKAHARGSSAKQDDVDVIWRVTKTPTGASLSCAGGSRLSWVDPTLKVDRTVHNGLVRYSAPIQLGWPKEVFDKAKELDDLGVPLDAGRRTAIAALRSAGRAQGKKSVLDDAIRYRKGRGHTAGAHPSAPVPGTTGGHTGGTL